MKIFKFILGKLSSRISRKGKNNKVAVSCKKVYKHSIKIKGNDNTVLAGENFCCNNIILKISGNNNQVIIKDNFNGNNIEIRIVGDNNNVLIDNDVVVVEDLKIYVHEEGCNRTITIGEKTTFFKSRIFNYDNNSSVTIGKDCMFAYNTTVYNTDSHSVFQNGKLINKAENLMVGNHVWICENAEILKNSTVPNGCVVAKNALVSGRFEEENVILAGVGAKVIKKDIVWDRKSVNEYLKAGENK